MRKIQASITEGISWLIEENRKTRDKSIRKHNWTCLIDGAYGV
jgi:hypothetical protein